MADDYEKNKTEIAKALALGNDEWRPLASAAQIEQIAAWLASEGIGKVKSPESDGYEYGIHYFRHSINLRPPHREGMSHEQAIQWLKEWIDDGGRPDAFVLIRRPVGKWERVDG